MPRQADYNAELEEYKKRVYEKALEVRRDQGWCAEGFRDVMRELDIELEPRKKVITFNLQVEIEVDVAAEDDDDQDAVEEFVRYSDFSVEVSIHDEERITEAVVTSVEPDVFTLEIEDQS